MEELLLEGYRYKFTVTTNRTFIADFHHINDTSKTLFVSRYTDDNGCVPGIRTMPFQWIKQIELIEDPMVHEIESIDLSAIPITNKIKKVKKTKKNNNYIA